MERQSLADYLDATARVGKIPSPAEIVQLLMPIAAALDSAHQRGELHGALKPSVILLDTGRTTPPSPGEPTITNFGMYQGQDPRLLSPNDAAYIAPEVAQGYAATSRSDLYSLGVILYELCTGTLPFHGETTSDILMQHIRDNPISPVLINPQIPPGLAAVIMRSLAREPAARFSSATALVTAVARAMNISVPESTSYSNPRISSSLSGIDTSNSPTYLVSPPSSPLVSPPSSPSSPVWPQVPASPSLTPVLPVTPTGNIPRIQPSPVTPIPAQASGPHPVISGSGPMQVVRPISPPPPQAQRPRASLFTLATATSKRRISILAVLAVLLVLVLLGSGLLLYLSATPASAPSQALVGHAFFVSSGLIGTDTNQGITDELRVSLQNVGSPQPDKRYYGWLMGTGTSVPVALGPLAVDHKQISITYVDPNHNNLLANYGRFLITEQDASQDPTNPSLDIHDWRYYSAFSTGSNPTDPKHYTLLEHLRHLLSQDPKLHDAGLSGGLSKWLYRNTTKILEAAGSARDAQKGCTNEGCAGLISRQVARILDYLDGSQYVQTENIPSSIQTPDHLLIDSTIGKVAMLEFDPVSQQPPGYLKHIGTHLQDLSQISSATPNQHALANRINQDIDNVQGWLNLVHTDASDLIHMTPADLESQQQPGGPEPTALQKLNDLFNNANVALVGQVDPNTDNVKAGVLQIYYNIQALATFDVAPCTINNGQSSCAEGRNGQ